MDLIIRADAAARVGKQDHAWASLNRLLSQSHLSSGPRFLARRALVAAKRLKKVEASRRTVEALRKIANTPSGRD